jgi:hypothetical protein
MRDPQIQLEVHLKSRKDARLLVLQHHQYPVRTVERSELKIDVIVRLKQIR